MQDGHPTFSSPALLQILAAAETGRDVAYFTFGDRALMRDVGDLHKFLTDSDVSVGEKAPLTHLTKCRDCAECDCVRFADCL